MLKLARQLLATEHLQTQQKLLEELFKEISSCSKEPGDIQQHLSLSESHLSLLQQQSIALFNHPKKKININNVFEYNQDVISKFVFLLFRLHVGWSDSNELHETGENLMVQQKITQICENLVTWLENHDNLSYNLLSAYSFSVKSCQSMPVLRKHVIYSFFHWLKNLPCHNMLLPNRCFLILKDLLVLCLTDIWSAIRKDTASRMHLAIDLLNKEQLKGMFDTFVKICDNQILQKEKNWQAAEGAVRGIDKLILCCKWVATSNVSEDSASILIKIGRNIYNGVPDFMQNHTEKILFKLFANPQISIREIAGKAYSNFLSRSEYTYFVESFDKVVVHLQKQTAIHKNLNAYEAEGFLNALLFLIKSIPLSYIMRHWDEYWSMFYFYLQHPASTVRQITSVIFKYISVKDQSSPNLIKFLLQYFVKGWKVDKLGLTVMQLSNSIKQDAQNLSWQWKEGCLFTYELVLKILCTNYRYAISTTTSFQRKMSHDSNTQVYNFKGPLHRSYNFSHSLRKQKQLTEEKLHRSFTIVEEDDSNDCKTKCETLFKMMLDEEKGLLCCRNLFSISIGSPVINKVPDFDVKIPDYVNEHKILKWLHQQKYSSFQDILSQILLQVIECLQHDQWELRRMSLQLLPGVCDVVYHFKYDILENIYETSFKYVNSRLYYGALLCLLNSIKLYSKLTRCVNEKLSPVKYSEAKKKHWSSMISSIGRNMKAHVNEISQHQIDGQHSNTTKRSSCIIFIIYQTCFVDQDSYDKLICYHISCCHRNASRLNRNYVPSKEWKCFSELLTEIQPYIFEYVQKVASSQLLALLPSMLSVLFIPSSSAIDKQTFINSATWILDKGIDGKSEIKKCEREHLLMACEELRMYFHKNENEVIEMESLFEILLKIQMIIPFEFPMKAIEDALQARMDFITKDKCAGGNVANARRCRASHEDMLSFSTTSFDSTKFSDVDSSDNDESSDKIDDIVSDNDDDSDWDWSSSEESDNHHWIYEKMNDFLTELRHRHNTSTSSNT